MSDVQTHNIIPVELNCILHVNALTLSTWFTQLGNKEKADKYYAIANEFETSIHEVRLKHCNIPKSISFVQTKIITVEPYTMKISRVLDELFPIDVDVKFYTW